MGILIVFPHTSGTFDFSPMCMQDDWCGDETDDTAVASLRGGRNGPLRVTASSGDTLRKSKYFCGGIYRNIGQTIIWKGGEGGIGDSD